MTAPLEATAREFALASMAAAYPDEEFAATVRAIGTGFNGHEGVGALFTALEREGLDALRGRWIALFDHGKERVSLYETEYGRMRGMSKGNDLADLAGFYHAFGLDLDATEVHEMHDHVAVELEFYAMLLAKQAYLVAHHDEEGVAVVSDARRKFLTDHLGGFVPAIAARLGDDEVYGPTLAWCASLVESECRALGVTPTPLDYFADEEGRREMKCGSLPVLQ
ncbi:MAG: molecular chaperone TorD family protein [Myxococcales bacterium]|nr:molecular chaperone TorD family protein [Myxococcales bacterium]